MSNITDRGTLRGVIYRGAGSGTTDYTQLSNKPQINGQTLQDNQSGDDLDLIDKGSLKINEHTLEGSMIGDDLGLVNSADLAFNVGYAGNILHNIKYKNNTYNTYANPFSGASSDGNGTMGLVPAPLSSQGDYDKFLKGNGHWASVSGGIDYSLNEQNTGLEWVDGKTIYQKTIYISSTSGDRDYNHDISNLDKVIKLFGFGVFGGNTQLPLPYNATSGFNYSITLGNVTSTQFKLQCGSSISLTDVYVTFQYTKA